MKLNVAQFGLEINKIPKQSMKLEIVDHIGPFQTISVTKLTKEKDSCNR